jgi:hypothetical protein
VPASATIPARISGFGPSGAPGDPVEAFGSWDSSGVGAGVGDGVGAGVGPATTRKPVSARHPLTTDAVTVQVPSSPGCGITVVSNRPAPSVVTVSPPITVPSTS